MNRQRGASSLLLVLLLFIVAGLMLQGTRRQYQSMLAQVTFESRALAESARAESLLQWGRQQTWPAAPAQQCVQASGLPGQLCLRIFDDASALLIANSGGQWRWQSGTVSPDGVRFTPQGWSDFCPRREESQCRLP